MIPRLVVTVAVSVAFTSVAGSGGLVARQAGRLPGRQQFG